jgi:F-box protein 3
LPSGAQGRRGGGAVHTLYVSRGVEASASVIFMPEGSQWTYSIKLRLVPPGEPGHVPAAQRGFETCQLQSRHWAIEPGGSSSGRSSGRSSSSAASPVLEHVRGDGVVGAFPLLREGAHRADQQVEPQFRASRLREGAWADGSYVYQSCSGQNLPGGSFGGELTFVPGSLKNPTGEPFDVVVQPFALDIPDTIF